MNSPHTEHRPGVRPEYPGQMESDPIQVLHATIDRLITYLNHHQNPQTPVHQPLDPQQLAAHVDLTLGEAGLNLDELLPWIETYLHHSTATVNPRFLNLLFGGVNWPGLLGELVMIVTNTTLHTYDVAPLATLMELELVRTLRTLVGFSQGEGLLVSGGSQANLVALLCARHRYGPEVKAQGMQGPPLVAFVSDQAHYSYDRAMNTLGLGLNHLVKVPSTVAGQLDPQALEAAIHDHTRLGHRPFFIGATAGTTVRGWLISRVTGFPIHDLGCTLKAVRRDLAQQLELYGEMHRFIPILAHQIGARSCELVTNHRARKFGTTKYGLGRTTRVVLDLMTVRFLQKYFDSPMKFFGKLGMLVALIAIAAGGTAIGMKLLNGTDLTGNPLTLLTILATILSAQFFSLGLLGEVNARIYFANGRRQNYQVRDLVNFDQRDFAHPVRRKAG